MNKICNNKKMNFQECEMAILRMQIDKAQEIKSREVINSPETSKILNIVENYIRQNNLICYGGIAINALLPKGQKIYNEEVDLPDYDFFSPNALEDAKKLADEFYRNGFEEVEAKAAQHHNTFKVYVNFIGVADITYVNPELFKSIKKKAVKVNGILYTDANFLKMGMYLELSRPGGDTDRWEKVLKRLLLINKYYPIDEKKCANVNFQRRMEHPENAKELYDKVKDVLIEENVIFFGGYALSHYKNYMPANYKKKIAKIPDFDVISTNPLKTATLIQDTLAKKGFEIEIFKKDGVGDIIPEHYEVKLGNDTLVFIYQSIACHSYNVIHENGKKIRIATIDTILSFYFAFLYADRPYYDTTRLLCMARLLFKVQEKNRLEQKGILKRFSITCMGNQPSREELREEKSKMFNKLKSSNKKSKEYEEWFLNYRPDHISVAVDTGNVDDVLFGGNKKDRRRRVRNTAGTRKTQRTRKTRRTRKTKRTRKR